MWRRRPTSSQGPWAIARPHRPVPDSRDRRAPLGRRYRSTRDLRSSCTLLDMLDEPLPVDLPPELLDLVVAEVLRAGAISRRSYSEQDKWDYIAFGAVLWRLTWNHVAD